MKNGHYAPADSGHLLAKGQYPLRVGSWWIFADLYVLSIYRVQ